MWRIGQLLRNKGQGHALYAGFCFDKEPTHAFLKLEGDVLVKVREDGTEYTHLSGRPIPVGGFATALQGGFFGELDLNWLLKDLALYESAKNTLLRVR